MKAALVQDKEIPLHLPTKTDSLPRNIPFQEYLTLYDSAEGIRSEWVAGTVEVYAMSTGRKHAELLGFLHVLFMFFMSKHRPGKIYLSDFPMFINDTEPAREPDLMIVFQENQARVQPTYLDGPADLVLEIIPPESGSRDRGDKFIEYERFGVPEYWLIDPIRRAATVYNLNAEGYYQELGLDEHGRLTSKILSGFAIDPNVFWQDDLPFGGEILALLEAMKS